MSKKLVAYFSASGNTAKKAELLAKATNGDLYEIKPQVPYSKDDLDWTNKSSRSSVEMSDKNARPEFVKDNLNLSEYDLIYLGFPIWWYVAPRIINTFLESYDFSGKKIILFATSGSSGFGNTIEELKPSASNSEIVEGLVLNGSDVCEKINDLIKLA